MVKLRAIFSSLICHKEIVVLTTPYPPQISICITGNWSNDAV